MSEDSGFGLTQHWDYAVSSEAMRLTGVPGFGTAWNADCGHDVPQGHRTYERRGEDGRRVFVCASCAEPGAHRGWPLPKSAEDQSCEFCGWPASACDGEAERCCVDCTHAS